MGANLCLWFDKPKRRWPCRIWWKNELMLRAFVNEAPLFCLVETLLDSYLVTRFTTRFVVWRVLLMNFLQLIAVRTEIHAEVPKAPPNPSKNRLEWMKITPKMSAARSMDSNPLMFFLVLMPMNEPPITAYGIVRNHSGDSPKDNTVKAANSVTIEDAKTGFILKRMCNQ